MVVHYDAYTSILDNEDVRAGLTDCGVIIPEDYRFSSNWGNVTCKRCLKQKENILKNYDINEKAIIDEMGDMANFFNN